MYMLKGLWPQKVAMAVTNKLLKTTSLLK